LSHPAINLSQNKSQGIGQPFIELQSVDSTNNYAMAQVHAGLAFHGAAFFGHEQTAGKGQRGKSWVGSPGESILLSIVLEPRFLQITEAFILSAAISLGCHDLFNKYSQGESFIKWPNDIYWRDRKAGGILIESVIRSREWLFAIVGIGLNINQIRFPASLPNPVSLKQITGVTYPVTELAKELCTSIEKRFESLQIQDKEIILSDYNLVLYKRNETVRFKKDNAIFETTVRGVNSGGCLITNDSIERSFDFGELVWLL
jgi:BirA family biotin operon repressor/biotin-[acetyl-CoA-carboxylase] ligase